MHVEQRSEALNLRQALGILRRRAPLILLCVAVVAGAAFAFSKHQTKEYTATASLVFDSNPLSQQIAGLIPSSTTNQFVQQASNIELVGLGDAAAKTAKQLGNGLTEREVRKSISVEGQGESNVVAVSATSTSPVLAAKIASIYTREFVKDQQGANDKFFESALTLVNRELAELPPTQRFGPAAVALQNRAQTLRLLKALQTGNVYVAQRAVAPDSPSSPRTLKNTIVGGVLGLLLGLGLAFVLERFYRDRRIMEPEDLEASYDLPLLGTIPESTILARSMRGNGHEPMTLSPLEAEAFNLIRARLRFSGANRDLRTILVASAARGEGRTTISRHLAEAAAAMGSRALLLEADLRNPTLAPQLDLQAGPGLSEVLIGNVPADKAIQSVDVAPQPSYQAIPRTLDVLTCGAMLPANPGQLIESHSMEALLGHLRSTYDLIVIDTPPITAVSDAFSLLTKVDGVVIVSWIGRTPRNLAEQLHSILRDSRASQLGIVVNGLRASSPRSGVYPNGNGGPSSGSPTPPDTPPEDSSRSSRPIPTAET
jgi:capsular exopolysaccharide synthesis family protein